MYICFCLIYQLTPATQSLKQANISINSVPQVLETLWAIIHPENKPTGGIYVLFKFYVCLCIAFTLVNKLSFISFPSVPIVLLTSISWFDLFIAQPQHSRCCEKYFHREIIHTKVPGCSKKNRAWISLFWNDRFVLVSLQ